MSTTDTTSTAGLIHRMLAAAHNEGAPEPVSATVDTAGAGVHIHARTPVDASAWVGWWTTRGAHDWTLHTNSSGPYLHHHSTGEWRGWAVDVVHLTPIPADALADAGEVAA